MRTIGKCDILELRIDRIAGTVSRFVCPLMDCGKIYERSCDLITHFNVEVSYSLSSPYSHELE